VEDNEHNQFLAKTYLENKQAQVDIAENGEFAISKMEENKYDLVLMDLQMPIMDGYEATRHIRTKLKSNVPIIGCSAHSLVGEKQKCLKVGMNDYISKPYSEKSLIYSIVNCLNIKTSNIITDGLSLEDVSSDRFSDIIRDFEIEHGSDFVVGMLTIFKKRIPENILQLREGIVNKDLELLRQTSHLLAGSMSSMNFVEGNKLAKKVEKSAKDLEEEQTLVLTEKFITYLNKALNFVNEL
jgi:CheY-like chemotaxis protein/HPt (histidine-containing phosphotransfer) domain-containing protein